jgi:hypothetical protein
MRLAFLVPPGRGPGTRYAHGLAAALRKAGHEVQVGDDAPPGAIPVLDGALLPRPVPTGAIALLHRAPDGDWHPEAFARLVATSPAVLERLGDAVGRAAVVTPGFPSLPRSSGSGDPCCAILVVGAITARKNHETLLRALARLLDLDWTLTVAGGTAPAPEHVAILDQLAQETGTAQRLRFVPDPDDAALDALWRGADLFASATQWEGYSAALAEALRRGVPAAVSEAAVKALPGVPAVERWGVACPADDVDGLGKAMRRLIYDRDLRAALADGAWDAGQALPGWDEQARRFVAAVEGVG